MQQSLQRQTTGIQHTQEVKVEDGGNSGEARTEEIKLKVGEKDARSPAWGEQ